MKKKEEAYKENPIDQANLDIHFIEAFIDMLWALSANKGDLETLKTSTVSAMCFESRFKIDNIKKFIDGIPFGSVVFDTEGNIMPSTQQRHLTQSKGKAS